MESRPVLSRTIYTHSIHLKRIIIKRIDGKKMMNVYAQLIFFCLSWTQLGCFLCRPHFTNIVLSYESMLCIGVYIVYFHNFEWMSQFTQISLNRVVNQRYRDPTTVKDLHPHCMIYIGNIFIHTKAILVFELTTIPFHTIHLWFFKNCKYIYMYRRRKTFLQRRRVFTMFFHVNLTFWWD